MYKSGKPQFEYQIFYHLNLLKGKILIMIKGGITNQTNLSFCLNGKNDHKFNFTKNPFHLLLLYHEHLFIFFANPL